MTKEQLRVEMKFKRDSLPEQERRSDNEVIRNLLYQSKAYQECSYLLSYVSFGSEVDTHPIIQQALLDGKQVYIPRVNHTEMDFYQIQSLEHLVISKYGVPEPIANEQNRFRIATCAKQDRKCLMLLPGLAFDRLGNRIGYGGGYYDKYLSRYPMEYFHKIAIAYVFQLLDTLSTEEHDIRADAIITAKEYINAGFKSSKN